ncbi:hydroxyisourate hydrolase [Flavobacterium cucumis]|uniref:5-hydroxyisourate hydrolase n=1 Tax=Flavobacterium cucumis TaxID=416016 RepID=A0A1M7ZZN9_9FLAO|nr:hydroxyisourate hydrolase [Flavobacterium cucumis]SHO74319.1 5-hydroxyisourate hydrolase [Flavobacterium cucumis]
MKKLIFTIAIAFISLTTFSQNKNYQLSSHILDVSKGIPASGVTIKLEKKNEITNQWEKIDEKITDKNGRITDFLSSEQDNMGIYKLTFLTDTYFKKDNLESFYPFIEVVFQIKDKSHYHVPITLSAYGYATYRGN